MNFSFDRKIINNRFEISINGFIYEIKNQPTFYQNLPELIVNKLNSENNFEDFVNTINGSYYCLIKDIRTDKLFVFSDHLGLNAPYVNFEKEEIEIAKHYLDFDFIKINIDDIKLKDFFNYYLESYDDVVPISKMIKLKGGTIYTFEKNIITKEKKYWSLNNIKLNNKLTSFNDIACKIKALIDKAIELRIEQNKIVASHLSGGFDSSLITSILINKTEKVECFSWSPSKEKLEFVEKDERKYIELIAKKHALNVEFIDELKFSSNEIFPYHYSEQEVQILEKINCKGIKKIFSGLGGDEFLSIREGLEIDLAKELNFSFLKNKFFRKKLGVIKRDLIYPYLNITSTSEKKRAKELRKYFINSKLPKYKSIYHYKSRRKFQDNLLKCNHLQYNAFNYQFLGNHYGIEYCFPLLDINLIEFLLSVPSKFFYYKGEKRAIIKALAKEYLPKEFQQNNHKSEPALASFYADYYKESAIKIYEKINEFKNTELKEFINFDLIKKDFEKFKKVDFKGAEYLFSLLLYLETALASKKWIINEKILTK